ncbi:MAG: hypothetical protein HC905_14265 [Bacteroidales bacterium]|nr:hypothetical protein [Bacteroidales bacterium]
MNLSEDRYNKIIGKVSKIQPDISNPGELTDVILISIHKKAESKVSKSIRLIRPWLSTAAACMIGFYLFQNYDAQVPEPHVTIKTRNTQNSPIVQCFEQNKISEVNLFDSYRCYLKEMELKNKDPNIFNLK